ncbi:DivIVA domain-containing protein [Humidisolicoccus flavus]|uniref:DivIVA domain-containing protein n=1 Tax=Humidisolicoccus flavus TaxID=3111414 RepID=UPI00324EDC8E
MNTTFPRVPRTQVGYDIEQVEDFLEDARRAYATEANTATAIGSQEIRQHSFAMKRGGYSPSHVDAALERLEEAFAVRERERGIAEFGEAEYFEQIRSHAEEVLERLKRPEGERFERVSRMAKGYDATEVDTFCVRVAEYLEDGPELAPEEVRGITFQSVRGGYNEDQVDALFDSVVSLMLAVR